MCLYRIGPHQREGKASIYPVSLISFQPLEAKSAQACFMQHFTAQKTVRSNCLHCYHSATEPWHQPLEQVAVTLKAICITKEYLSCTKIQPTKHVGTNPVYIHISMQLVSSSVPGLLSSTSLMHLSLSSSSFI